MSFSVQNISETNSTNNTLYKLASSPTASLVATNFNLPLSLSLTATELNTFYFNDVLVSTNFFNPGAYVPEIAGNFLVSWTFNVALTAGINSTVTASIYTGFATNTYNFNITYTPNSYNFTTIIPCAGFSEDDEIQFGFTSPNNITIEFYTTLVNISYVSELQL